MIRSRWSKGWKGFLRAHRHVLDRHGTLLVREVRHVPYPPRHIPCGKGGGAGGDDQGSQALADVGQVSDWLGRSFRPCLTRQVAASFAWVISNGRLQHQSCSSA